VKAEDLSAVTQTLVGLAKEALLEKVAAAAGPDHAAALKARLGGLAERVRTEAKDLLALATLKVPKGTPVNLYFNLGASAIPYALKAHIKYRNDSRRLTEALLQLSECPDLVEDRGHTFGAELTDPEKRDLIEFLKTL
jgi:hypothetical protein